jgi:hypothetical protein
MYGHFFFAERTICGFIYLDMLENYLSYTTAVGRRGTSDLPARRRSSPFSHRSETVPQYSTFPEWIGRGGSIALPPRSPDLNPLYFPPVGLCQGSGLCSASPTNTG